MVPRMGIVVHDVTAESFAPFTGKTVSYDLLTGRLDDPPSDEPATLALLTALECLHRWLTDEVANEHLPGDIESAKFELTVGETTRLDLSEHKTYLNGPLVRDSTGHARVERIERIEIVPEWTAVPHVAFSVSIILRAKGKTIRYDSPSPINLQILPRRS